jgi:polyisoprenoid-binding protein YceI
VRLLWVHQISGRFARIDGDVTLSPRRDTAVVRATVLVDSVQMDSERMRRWVMTPEFFDAARYPTIQFTSSPFATHALEFGGELPGLLTLRGISRPVIFELQPSRCTMKPTEPCMIEVRGSIQRSDYDMTGHRTALSDRVQMGLLITIQPAQRQLPPQH